MNERPELNKELDAITFRNFYYLKQELIVGYAKYKLATYYASDCSAFSLIAIALTVRSSAKAKTIEEAQQRAVFLIFPILALVVGQFTGIILISTWLLLGLGAVLVILDVLLMKGVAKNFTYEKLLR